MLQIVHVRSCVVADSFYIDELFSTPEPKAQKVSL